MACLGEVAMQVRQSHLTDRSGVAAVQKLVLDRLGWLFREQPISDFGIDAHIEDVKRSEATGLLIGMQIRSGPSYFKEESGDAYVFRGNREHLDYWLNHTLPVVVVLYNPDTDQAYWQVVNENTVTSTGKGWKLEVPKRNLLDASAIHELRRLADVPQYLRRLSSLQAALAWMQLLSEGRRIFVEVEEWVNKTSGRGDFKFIVQRDDGSVESEWSWPFLLGVTPYKETLEALRELVPWADVNVDQDFYYLHEDDSDGQYGGSNVTGQEKDELRPYSEDGEVAHWRLELTLNELGRSFILVHRFLENGA